MTRAGNATARGTVDADGRLIASDPPLLALQRASGGELGGPLLVPPLASIARLVRSLGVMVSRPLTIAEDDRDVDLWVNAQPVDGRVELSISGWLARPAPTPSPALVAERARDFAALEADGEWACDAMFAVTSLSPAIAAVLGDDQAAMIGAPLTRLFRLIETEAGDVPLMLAAMQRAAFAGQLAELRAVPGMRVTLAGDPVFGATGAFSGYRGSLGFIDPPVSAAATADPVKGAADTADADFARRLERALRAPLSRIIANADEIHAIGNGPIRHTYVGYAQDISAAGRHLISLVDDLADLQAIERADFRIEGDSIDLADIARRASGLLSVRAADRNVRIDPPASDETLNAHGDFRRVLQIMVNLIGNAVRYSPEGASVWVRSEREGDLAAVIVADQGRGIAAGDQHKIFDKFERLDPSEPGGSGLGLYISRRLARAMGGDLTVDSAPGQGARFILTLPTG